MLTSFGSGEIWKGSNQEISVVLVPRCYKVEGEITDVVLNFYTTAGGTSIEFSGDTVTVSGINATVVFQPVQLDTLDDGLIRYNVAFNEGGESHVFDLETRYLLKTPNDYEPVDYVTHAEVEGVVDELLVEKLEDYYTSGETNEAISNAMAAESSRTDTAIANAIAAETARTEQTYLKEHQSLADYWTSTQTESAITNAIDIESARTDTAINDAIAAETARTESTYLKEHQSLDNYYTKSEVDEEISDAVSAITMSGVTRQELNEAIAAETARTENTYLKEHQSLDDYYTKEQTDSAITAAIEAQSGTTSAQTQEMITEAMAAETARTEQAYLKHGALEDYYTSAQTDTAIQNAVSGIDLSDYYTTAQTDSKISEAIATESARTEQTYLKPSSLDDYWTSAQTQSAITSALTDYYTSGQTNTAISNAVNDKVSSSSITQIWSGSQQAYDAMTGHSANILYIINS
jgi:hypothetical protein